MQTKEIKEMIYSIAKGLAQWEEKGWTEIPETLYKGHLLFMKNALQSNMHPNNVFDLIKLLHEPVEKWGIDGIEKLLPSDSTFLVEGFGLSIDIEDFLEEYTSPEEFDQSVMKEILQYCRDNGLDEEYRKIRSILASPDNAVLTYVRLRSMLYSIKDNTLKQLLENCYEEVPHSIDNYKKCPYCGWTVSFIKGRWRCNKEQICGHFQSFERLETYEFSKDETVYRVRPGIQRYVSLTGMIEEKIWNRLKEYDAVLYPDIDEFDIRINVNDTLIDLDVKDYRSPRMLANAFNDKNSRQLQKYHKNSYIIIPNYRLKMNPNYKELVCSSLNKESSAYIQIMTERELFKCLKEGTLCSTN
ncbi:restriction endonuclease-related protein [Bacillus cereus]|uniref:restriction endonuclease-related protein n=1 Tax=Bacillus cereus TaxID=1396 RepID=UPI000BF79AD8|nr:hypothetical protein [Bacillus cereus]PER25006.1 hypothetical protein CN476_13220 [Bacillus cereus]